MSPPVSLRFLLGATVANLAAILPSAAQNTVQLPPVEVAGTASQEPPAATSTVTRAQIDLNPPNQPADIFRDVPGVWSADDGTPGLSIGIRGMQDFGRVNVMIDGARQNFQSSGHNANGTVYVDPALLSGVDIARGTVTTTNGAGAIGGVVNLRTIGADDVLRPGQTFGAISTLMGGTNNYDGSGMVAISGRPNPDVGMTAAFSMRNSGNWDSGAGVEQLGTAQKLFSGLVKLETKLSADQHLDVGGVFYGNSFGTNSEGVNSYSSIQSNTFTVKYGYQPAGSHWIDFNAGAYFANTTADGRTDGFYGTAYAPPDATRVTVNTAGFTLDNTSRAALGPVGLSVTYGGEYFHDSVSSSSQIYGSGGETPEGGRDVGGGFVQATATYGIVSLIPGIRIDGYGLNGSGFNSYAYSSSVPYGPYSVNKSASGVSPKVALAVKPLQGLEFYGSYGDGWRPPALTETLWSGAHPGLSFIRFLPNPNLNPETTHGYELGVKTNYTDVLQANDRVTLKADWFHTDIDDYIAQFLSLGRPASGRIPAYLYTYDNVSGTTKTEGFELEASYDSGPVFARLAWTNVLTQLPLNNKVESNAGHVATEPPRNVFTGTLGFRFFEEKLTVGGRIKAVSATDITAATYTGASRVSGYTTFDLFGQYRLTDNVKLFASIQNLGDLNYRTDVLSPTYQPGLMAMFGITAQLGK